jgi:transposase
MRNFGILEKFHGRAVHDYFKSYYQFENFLHSLCNAHLIRELIFLDEKLGEKWASEMIGLLLEAKLLRTREDNRPAGRRRVIGEKTRKRIRSRYLIPPSGGPPSGLSLRSSPSRSARFEIVAEGRRKNPEPDPPPEPKRGRPKRGKPRNMLDRLESRYDEVMAFFEHEGVPFDNNQAERDLRMAKLRDKISGTFRSARHALAFCNLHGVMSTARKQKRPMLETLGELLSSPETLGKSLASQG